MQVRLLCDSIRPQVESIVNDRDADSNVRLETQRFATHATQMENWFLDHIHGVAAPGITPDMMQLGRALQVFKSDCAQTFGVVSPPTTPLPRSQGATAKGGGWSLPIIAGLVAMWITYALAHSVGWAWVAFFVVGGLVYENR
jgi:hypothetical protein